MLYFVVVFSLLSVAYAEGDEKPFLHLSPPDLKVVKDAAADCITELEVRQEISDNFFKLIIDSDVDTQKFLYCMCRKSNYADEDGHFNDNVIALFDKNHRDYRDEVQVVIDNCNKVKGEDKYETILKTIQCFYKNTPVLVGE